MPCPFFLFHCYLKTCANAGFNGKEKIKNWIPVLSEFTDIWASLRFSFQKQKNCLLLPFLLLSLTWLLSLSLFWDDDGPESEQSLSDLEENNSQLPESAVDHCWLNWVREWLGQYVKWIYCRRAVSIQMYIRFCFASKVESEFKFNSIKIS